MASGRYSNWTVFIPMRDLTEAELRELLELYRDAVRIDVLMEGPYIMCNLHALKKAYKRDCILTDSKP